MIRHRRGDEFLLITQHDHALLSGRFAARLGNGRFSPPSPLQETVDGVSLHDCGWPVHDDRPTLNGRGEPLHVLESPIPLAVHVWSESATRAAERGDYCGLLVSLHVMGLSAIATQTADPAPHERARSRNDLFELHKFQHKQVERQEELRRRLGLRTDVPLHFGLAKPGVEPAEDLLRFNFKLLAAMDRLSLDLCCSEHLFGETDDVHPKPGAAPVKLRIEHAGPGVMRLDPWPFGDPSLEDAVPCRRMPAARYGDEEQFRAAYVAAPVESFPVRLEPAAGAR